MYPCRYPPSFTSAKPRNIAPPLPSGILQDQGDHTMNKTFAGGGLLLGIVGGIIFGNLALGILFGLMLGGSAGAVKAKADARRS